MRTFKNKYRPSALAINSYIKYTLNQDSNGILQNEQNIDYAIACSINIQFTYSLMNKTMFELRVFGSKSSVQESKSWRGTWRNNV